MIPNQAHYTAFHEKYPSRLLLQLMQQIIGQIQVFQFDWLRQHYHRVPDFYARCDI